MNKFTKNFFVCALAAILAVGMISCNVDPTPPSDGASTDSDTHAWFEEDKDTDSSNDNSETTSSTDETDRYTGIPSVSETTKSPETENLRKQPKHPIQPPPRKQLPRHRMSLISDGRKRMKTDWFTFIREKANVSLIIMDFQAR